MIQRGAGAAELTVCVRLVTNLSLLERRADAVRAELVAAGIDPARLVARGLGETYPKAPNDTAAGRQQNRRVEVVIQEGGA